MKMVKAFVGYYTVKPLSIFLKQIFRFIDFAKYVYKNMFKNFK